MNSEKNTTHRRKATVLILLAVLVAAAVLIYNYFDVRGSEIKGIKELDDTCTVEISSYTLETSQTPNVVTLSGTQITELKDLITNSHFTLSLSQTVIFNPRTYTAQSEKGDETVYYDIKIVFDNDRAPLYIHSIQGYYISVTEQFNDHFLKIRNPEWEMLLKQVMRGD